jgi:hypothetical protein
MEVKHNSKFPKMEYWIPFYGTKVDLSNQSRYPVKYVELSFVAKNRNCSFCSNEQQRDTHFPGVKGPVDAIPVFSRRRRPEAVLSRNANAFLIAVIASLGRRRVAASSCRYQPLAASARS